MAIQRLRCAWQGVGVEGPGLSTFYAEADGTLAIQVAAAALFNAVRALIPTGTTIDIPQGGDLIDEATGQLTGTWGGTGRTQISGSGSGTFPGGVGARIVWQTAAIRAGRRVRGSTFIVPLVSSAYGTVGDMNDATMTALQTGATNFMTQVPTQARVWSRPRPGLPGAAVQITSGLVPDKVSWLRSRRT